MLGDHRISFGDTLKRIILVISALCLFLAGCKRKERVSDSLPVLTEADRHLCDSLQIAPSVAKELKSRSGASLSRLRYSFGASFGPDGNKIIEPSGYHQGLMIHIQNGESEPLVDALSDSFRRSGHSLFVVDKNFGIDGQLDDVALVKDTNIANIIRMIGTDGANYGVSNDSVVSIFRSFSSRYPLRLVGVSGDWISLRVTGGMPNWDSLAKVVAEIAPDVVSQGPYSIDFIAKEMESSKTIYLWWD